MKKLGFFGLYDLISLFLLPFFLLFMAGTWVMKPAWRPHLSQRFGRYPAGFFHGIQGKTTVFWVHAASVGEVMMSRLFVQSLRIRYPEACIVFSTVTPTGQAAAREHLGRFADLFIYFPFDFCWVAPSVVQKISPSLFVFMETEIWPNCLKSLDAMGVPAILTNGRISNRSFPRYKRFRPFLSQVLKSVSLFLMQSEADVERIVALGAPPDRVEQTGNMKYDQAVSVEAQGGEISAPTLADLALPQKVVLMIAGSTRPGEEAAVLDAYEILLPAIPTLVLMIAPRHLKRLSEVEKLLSQRGYVSLRKSLLAGPSVKTDFRPAPVILLDTLGELARLYALGTYIFVGGSLADFGGHNPLEPAAGRKPVFFGPHMENFEEITKELTAAGGGIQVSDGKTLGKEMLRLAQNPEDYEQRAIAAYHVVLKSRGAVARNLAHVVRLMDRGSVDKNA